VTAIAAAATAPSADGLAAATDVLCWPIGMKCVLDELAAVEHALNGVLSHGRRCSRAACRAVQSVKGSRMSHVRCAVPYASMCSAVDRHLRSMPCVPGGLSKSY
jgi:hypothetical protein